MTVIARAAVAALLVGGQVFLAPHAMAADAAPPQTKAEHKVEVPLGTTARDLAAEYVPPGVTLDQMLVALLQANPQAFAGGNINRLLAGAQLVLPNAAQAQQVNAEKARQAIAQQGREFNQSPPSLTPAPAVAANAEPVVNPAPSTAPGAGDLGKVSHDSASAAVAAPTEMAAATPAANAPASAPGKSGLVHRLLGHPAVLPATAALLTLMAALAGLRSRQRKGAAATTKVVAPSDATATAPAMADQADLNSTPPARLDPRLNAALMADSQADVPTVPSPAAEAATAPAPAPAPLGYFDLDLTLGDEPATSRAAVSTPAATQSQPSATPSAELTPLKRVAQSAPAFDLNSLSLDLGEPSKPPAPQQKAPS